MEAAHYILKERTRVQAIQWDGQLTTLENIIGMVGIHAVHHDENEPDFLEIDTADGMDFLQVGAYVLWDGESAWGMNEIDFIANYEEVN